VHDASSRSHAIIKLRLRVSPADPDQRRGTGSKSTEAIVSLVDLAGSERASETKQVIPNYLCGLELLTSGFGDVSDKAPALRV
jgi:hypothetical protein